MTNKERMDLAHEVAKFMVKEHKANYNTVVRNALKNLELTIKTPLQTALHKHNVYVRFEKVGGGTTQHLATLQDRNLPESLGGKSSDKVVTFYSLTRDAWRCCSKAKIGTLFYLIL